MKMTPSCSARRGDSINESFNIERSTLKSDLGSGQGQVMTHVCQYAYHPDRIDELSCLASFSCIYSILSRAIGEKRIVTSCNLR